VRAIREWSSPRSMFEVRIFHGLASFYRKFIMNFSSICAPILETIKKEHGSFNWTKEAEKGFRVLKEKITKKPSLVLPDFKKTFQVKCDASGVTIGIVLSQDNKHVSYFNEKLKMKNIGPCKILRKLSTNPYDIELLEDIGISPIFNVANLYPYMMDDTKGTDDREDTQWKRHMTIAEKPRIEKILDQRIAKNTKRKVYYEYMVKWKDHPIEDASWITETDIKKDGNTMEELMDRSP
jgi:hypothetical protein